MFTVIFILFQVVELSHILHEGTHYITERKEINPQTDVNTFI